MKPLEAAVQIARLARVLESLVAVLDETSADLERHEAEERRRRNRKPRRTKS